jgi:type VII secretion-associated protein (TIGR03931 family)
VELRADVLHRTLGPHLAPVVDGVRRIRGDGPGDDAGPGRAPPVLLIGGLARMPLLAELFDAARVGDVRVADRPDSAAVVGALRLPRELLGLPSVRPGLSSVRQPGATGPEVPPGVGPPAPRRPTPTGGAASMTWLPAVPPRRLRPVRGVAVAAASAAALVGLYAAGATLPAPGPVSPAAAGELVQYGYAVLLPAGWAHTGGLPERRRSLLTPAGAPDGSNLISVERTPLGYDADAEPRRARAELRAEFARAVADGAPLSGFDDDARFAGRPVVGYREAAGGGGRGADDPAQVDRFVVLDGDAQLSVGCRYTAGDATAVAEACATVVGSVRRTA